jgi:hypothetical protein
MALQAQRRQPSPQQRVVFGGHQCVHASPLAYSGRLGLARRCCALVSDSTSTHANLMVAGGVAAAGDAAQQPRGKPHDDGQPRRGAERYGDDCPGGLAWLPASGMDKALRWARLTRRHGGGDGVRPGLHQGRRAPRHSRMSCVHMTRTASACHEVCRAATPRHAHVRSWRARNSTPRPWPS